MPPSSHQPDSYDGPRRDEVLALRRKHVAPGTFLYYKNPLQIVDGYMQYIWDDSGRRYLDAIAGIAAISVGHCHPRIVEAVRKQVGHLMHTTTLYLHPSITRFAEALAKKFPDKSLLSVTHFTNSGSEANDLATMLARLFTGHFDLVSLRNGYHGGSPTAMGLTALNSWKFPIPQTNGVHHACPGYCYRCPLGLEYPSCDTRCARDVAALIDYETPGRIAAFIAEPIQGVGGVIDPPPEYFKIIYETVRAHGGLCISDEVQTGFGRLGTHFFGFEAYDVVPDIVTMAKGIGNGAPLGAVTTRPEIAECLTQKLHFNTFAGNPLAMIQGLTTLEILEREQLQQNAHDVGGYLKERLIDLQNRHTIIGDVRGRGLMLGVELVRDRTAKEPASKETAQVHEGMKDRLVLLGKGGLHGNVLRIKPPLCITRADADFLVEALDDTLASLK